MATPIKYNAFFSKRRPRPHYYMDVQQLYDLLPPISKTIHIRRTRHDVHCWRCKDELISDVLLWTSSYWLESIGRPTKISQLCTDTGFSLEDLPDRMDDKDEWRELGKSVLEARYGDGDNDDILFLFKLVGLLGFMVYKTCRLFSTKSILIQIISFISNNF